MNKLDKLRDEMAFVYANKFVAVPRKELEPWQEEISEHHKDGFNAARDLLLPEALALVAAIRAENHDEDKASDCLMCAALARWEKFIGEGE